MAREMMVTERPSDERVRFGVGLSEKEWDALDRTAIAAWVKELREGDQMQAIGYLKVVLNDNASIYLDDRYQAGRCCLGVACDMFAEGLGLKISVKNNESSYRVLDVIKYGDATSELPSEVAVRLGFPERKLNPSVWYSYQSEYALAPSEGYTSVAELNDEACLTFPEIADCIEATYLAGWEG